jgi:hypothetical protein
MRSVLTAVNIVALRVNIVCAHGFTLKGHYTRRFAAFCRTWASIEIWHGAAA